MKTGGKRIAVALTGASGAIYGSRLVRALVRLEHEVHLVVSDAAVEVARLETGVDLPSTGPSITRYGEKEIGAPMASGSYPLDGMVIAPCTMATLSAVANGLASNLTHRAADVCLKEGRTLILVPRETPLNRIHMENMLKAHDAGAVIMPAMPPFYGRPGSVEEVVDHMVGRILDRLGVDNDLAPRWEG